MPELVCSSGDGCWLEERRKGVTATDIVAIAGLAPASWQVNAYSLYWRKLGIIPDEHEDTDRLRLGRDLEPLIADRWALASDLWVGPGGLFRSSARSWQMATPDRLVSEHITDEGLWRGEPLELKSWADTDRKSWDDGPPPHIRAQVLWQMDVLDTARGHVGMLFLPSGEFRSYVLEHPLSAEHDTAKGIEWAISGDFSLLCSVCRDIMLLRQAGDEFMRRLSHALPPPSPDGSLASLAALKARFADPRKTKEAEIDALAWDNFEHHKNAASHHEACAKNMEAIIREQAGDAGILTVGGVKVATRQRYTVKAHMRKESVVDKIVRSRTGEDG